MDLKAFVTVEIVTSLCCQRLAMATPHNEEYDTENIKYFERDGFKVTSYKNFFHLIYYLISYRKEFDIIHLHTAWSTSNLIVFYFSKLR